MAKIDLSIIIVNFNTEKLLENLLSSCFKADLKGINIEIIVVDNASTDNSLSMIKSSFSRVKIIENKKNIGFGKANNRGIKIAKGKYILFLNSDTLVQKDTFKKMIKFLDEKKEFSAATCRVELENGQIDPACHRGFPTPWAAFTYFSGLEKLFPKSKIFGQYHQTWKDLQTIHEIDALSGAFFMIRKSVLDKVGLFDEDFFMYGEDLDLCLRMKNKGYKIAFFPNTKVIHLKHSSGRKISKGKKITQSQKETLSRSRSYFFETMKLFYDKHYKEKYLFIVRWLVLLGIWIISHFKR